MFEKVSRAEATLGIWVSVAVSIIGGIGWVVSLVGSRLKDPANQERIASASEQTVSAAKVGAQTAGRELRPLAQRLVAVVKYLFTFEGRVKRLPFFLSMLVNGLVLLTVLLLLLDDPELFGRITLTLLLLSLAQTLAFVVRRTRDTGVNQWWFLMLFVPPVNLAFQIFLLFVPTDEFRDHRF